MGGVLKTVKEVSTQPQPTCLYTVSNRKCAVVPAICSENAIMSVILCL